MSAASVVVQGPTISAPTVLSGLDHPDLPMSARSQATVRPNFFTTAQNDDDTSNGSGGNRSRGNGGRGKEDDAGATAEDSSGDPYSAGVAATAVGQLLSPSSSCTATVIASKSKRLAITAAHCVYVTAQRPQPAGQTRKVGWIPDLTFYPGRKGDNAAHGAWPVTYAWIDAAYRDNSDPTADIAFIELGDQDGRTAQQALGAEGIAFHDHPTAKQATTMLGYPVEEPFDGTALRRCSTGATTLPYRDILAMPCQMTGGSSGGPWLTGFNAKTGQGTVTAVTGFRSNDYPDLLAAAGLGPLAADLLDEADNHASKTDTDSDDPDHDPGNDDSDDSDGSDSSDDSGTHGRDSGRARSATPPAPTTTPAARPRTNQPTTPGVTPSRRPAPPTSTHAPPATPRVPSNHLSPTRTPTPSATRTNSALSSPAPTSTALPTRNSAASISRDPMAGGAALPTGGRVRGWL